VPCKYTSCCPCDFIEIRLFPTIKHTCCYVSTYPNQVDVYLALYHLLVRISFGRKLLSAGDSTHVTVTAVTLLSFAWLKWVRVIALLNFVSFDVEYICGFVWWGVCKQSRWRHSVTVPHTRWRICVTMTTLWQQQDGGYMLLWKRYGNNKMAAIYSTSSTVQS